MAQDAYQYPLLVEFEQNKVPRLKNQLAKYFQRKKSSHGGDCTVEHASGSRCAVVRFREQQDQRNVLKNPSHQLQWDKGFLKLTVRETPEDKQESPVVQDRPARAPGPGEATSLQHSLRPAGERVDLGDEEPLSLSASVRGSVASEPAPSTASVVGNVPSDMTQEFVEMLVENIMKKPESGASEGATVEMIPASHCAVVSFKTKQENSDFVFRCPQNRTFKSKHLSVKALDPTTQVLMEDASLDQDLLTMYLDNKGVVVEEIKINPEQQNTVITFTSATAVRSLQQKPLQLQGKQLKLYPFYECLGCALYGSDRPPLRLPPPVSEGVDRVILRYLWSRPSLLQLLQAHLKVHLCQVDLQQTSVRLSPETELLQQPEEVLREWPGTVRSVLSQFVSKYKLFKLNPPPDLWKQSVEKISTFLKDENNILMCPDETNGVINVVGPESDISKLQEPLCESINSLIKRARRDKLVVTEPIKVSMSVFNLLSQDGFQQKLLSVYPELKFQTQGPFPKITGLMDEIVAANKVILDEMFAMKRQNLEIDRYVLEFLKNEDQEEVTNTLLCGKYAVLEIHQNRIQLVACSDRDLHDAETHLKSILVSQYVDVEDSSVLLRIEWQQLVDQFEKEDNMGNKVQIRSENEQVIVSGFKDNVTRVSHKLDDFLKQNTNIQESVAVNPVAKLEYLQSFQKSKIEQLNKDVVVNFTKDAISLSGTRANVKDCVVLVEDLVDLVVFEKLTVAKHGARKLFEGNDANHLTIITTQTGCLVKIADKTDAIKDIPMASLLPTADYEIQTPDGVKILVSNADMCSYPVDMVVNATVENLDLSKGLSAALLKAAGFQLQDACAKIILSRGSNLKPGDCEVTDAGGNLYCKKIIHTVGPKYETMNSPKALALLKRAVKGSLHLAEQDKCNSLALPAISRNRGFPLHVCAQTIVKAIKEYCEDRFGECSLSSIHLVNNDDAAVRAMEDAVKKEFGDKGISHKMAAASSSTQRSPKSSKTSAPSASASDPSCVGKVRTKEGLEICVFKGNLERATTDIIVNTVTEDLLLTRGAVSSAVVAAAGPLLQQMVTSKQGQASVGQVIVTEGCQLTCRQVYHAVPPHYDSGQGAAQKQLTGIFTECLSKAEDTGMSSISFSAMGTGNLGFPKDLVASLVLDQILDFSSKKQPKNLKKVHVVLFPGDAQTIQAFSHEFQKKFPKAGGSSLTAPPAVTGPFSKIVSSSSKHETKLGTVTVQVVTGDITKETTDVIVNSSNDKFSLKSGVSKAILDAAGPAVETECQTLGSQPNTGMILTQPGNLKCKKILHVVGQTDPTKITKAVREALQAVIKNSLCSVAFPAIGTGQGNVGAKSVADAMFDGVIEVLTKNQGSSLKTVKIVIFQNQMLKDFHNSLQQRAASESKDKDKESGMWARVKSWFSSGQETQKTEDYVIEALKPAPVCLHICGEFNFNINAAKQKIDSILSKELCSQPIKDEMILSLSTEDLKRLEDLQKKMEVGIRIESKNGIGCITIEGLPKDVLLVNTEIQEILKTTRQEEDLNQKAALLSAVVEWQYMDQGQDYKSFDPKTSYELEQALEKKDKQVKVKLNGVEFTVKMPKGPGTAKNGTTFSVQRINKMSGEDLPEFWDNMDTSSTKVLPVSSGSAEYKEVEQLFKASCNRNIVKIERIQNPVLWQSLQIKKRAMDVKNGHSNNERRLFHGTSDDTIAVITEHGFNRSYAGKNATAYGRGTYFAVNAHYSSGDTYSRPRANGEKLMYLCRVLTGDFAAGQANMIEPPPKQPGSIEKFDSVVDNTLKPTMFIIFHDTQAYPEYLITFT